MKISLLINIKYQLLLAFSYSLAEKISCSFVFSMKKSFIISEPGHILYLVSSFSICWLSIWKSVYIIAAVCIQYWMCEHCQILILMITCNWTKQCCSIIFSWLDTLGRYSAISYIKNNFWNSLFALPHTKPFLRKLSPLVEGHLLSWEQILDHFFVFQLGDKMIFDRVISLES